MDRICPNCNVKLGDYDHFFCTSCGSQLPDTLVKRQANMVQVATFLSKPRFLAISPKYVKLFLLMLFIGAFFATSVTVVYFYLSRPQSSKTTQNTPMVSPSYIKGVTESNLDWATNTFGTDHLLEYVPFDAALVIEGHDLKKFAASYSAFDGAYKTLADSFLTNSDGHFVFFANKTGSNQLNWSLIILPSKNFPPISDNILNQYPWLKFWKDSPILLITTNDSVLTNVIDAKGKTAKNFTQTPIYAASKNVLPKNGKLLIYVADQTSRDNLQNYLNSSLPEDAKKVVESISKSNLDFEVIL